MTFRSSLGLVPVVALLVACSSDPNTLPGEPGPEPQLGSDGGGTQTGDAGKGADGAVAARDAGGEGGKADASAPPPPPVDAGSSSIQQHCVDKINQYRATLSLPPLARMSAKESCADGQAKSDAMSNTPHGAFGQCSEFAQNECPGWPSANMQQSLDGCLQMMWNEGPGADFSKHGHYINMSSTKYTKVFCGFYDLGNGKFWSVQDFQ
jgi:hypothetical protein